MSVLSVRARETKKFRVYEKQGLHETFDGVCEHPLGSAGLGEALRSCEYAYWRLESERLSTAEFAEAVAVQQAHPDVRHINSPMSHPFVHAKDLAFEIWEEYGLPVPPWAVFHNREELREAISEIGFPLLLRINNHNTGKFSWLCHGGADVDSCWEPLRREYEHKRNLTNMTEMIAVGFINTERMGQNVSYRIIVAGEKVICGYARTSPPSDWVAITGKFSVAESDVWVKMQERCAEFCEKNHDMLVNAVKAHMGHLLGVDVIESSEGEPYLIETQNHFSCGYHDDPDYRPPFHNPNKPELVNFLLANEDELKKRIPFYWKWLDKKAMFLEAFAAAKEAVDVESVR